MPSYVKFIRSIHIIHKTFGENRNLKLNHYNDEDCFDLLLLILLHVFGRSVRFLAQGLQGHTNWSATSEILLNF